MKFKIGDKVKCVRGIYLYAVEKAIGVIAGEVNKVLYVVDYSNDLKNVNRPDYLHTCDGKLKKATGYYILENDLELVLSKTSNIDKY